MKPLYLKQQQEILKLENVADYKRKARNSLIDEKKKAKKEKDEATLELINRQLTMAEQDLINIEHKVVEAKAKMRPLQMKLGKIRLDCYLYSDILYDAMIRYEEFLNTHCINNDKETLDYLRKALENIKKLPQEMATGYGANETTNALYNAVTDKFLERWNNIRDGVFAEVMRDVGLELG